MTITGATGSAAGAEREAQSAPAVTVVDGTGRIELAGQRVATFQPQPLGDTAGEITVRDAGGGWQHVRVHWAIDEPVQQDDLAVELDLTFKPDFHWLPHLTPDDGWVVAQHSFQSPAIIAARQQGEPPRIFALVPDLERVGQVEGQPWYLDLDAPAGKAWIGLSQTQRPVHVGWTKAPGMTLQPVDGGVELAFYVTAYEDTSDIPNPFARVTRFLWERYARPLYDAGEPSTVPMDTFVRHTYDWAFDRWGDVVWQEFELDGRRVGAPQFIVNVSQSPNYEGPWYQREELSIWNQAWFSSLRSASGLKRWSRRTDNAELAEKADLSKELALAAPGPRGLFAAVIAAPNERRTVDGQEVVRSRGWEHATWTNSNRHPGNYGTTRDWYHLLDSSFTALLMLQWHEDLEADERLLDKARTYADTLLALQDEQGFFPGWLHPETLEPAPVMNQTPETSMSVTFLLKLAKITGEAKYREAALRAMDAVVSQVVPVGQWEDFETYWSCCPFGREDHVGRQFERNDQFKQNTLSMYWTAQALLEAYEATGEQRYLDWGRRTLDELSMFQQVWQPPYIYVPALGGFKVMNFDGEWNDARQSLFAPLYLEYYRVTGEPELFERGIAAMRASFIMMYCPENPHVKEQYEKVHPFFGPEDYGFMMENYAHGGETSPEGVGIGPFTIYDWGNGAASETRNRVWDRFGDVYIDPKRGHGFGIDAVRVERSDTGWTLTDLADQPRTVKVVFADGTTTSIELNGTATLP